LAIKDTSNRFYYDLPVFFTTKLSEQISANYLYLFQHCEITQKNKGEFKLKIPKEKIKLKKKISLVEARFKIKNKVRLILEKNIHDIRVQKFFQAMSLGYSDYKLLSYEFSKAGIQHLLTISGFHFALVFLFILPINILLNATYFTLPLNL
jgi:competence protein ComEC